MSYCDTVEEIQAGLSKGKRGQWELVRCQIASFLEKPAHFVAIKNGQSIWSRTSLDVLVVRERKLLKMFWQMHCLKLKIIGVERPMPVSCERATIWQKGTKSCLNLVWEEAYLSVPDWSVIGGWCSFYYCCGIKWLTVCRCKRCRIRPSSTAFDRTVGTHQGVNHDCGQGFGRCSKD